MNPIALILLIVLAGAVLLVYFGLRASRSKAKGDIAERIEFFGGVGFDSAGGETREARDEPNRVARSLEEIVKGRNLAEQLSNMLMRADVRLTIGELLLIRLGAAAGGFFLGFLFVARIQPAIAVLVGVVTGLIGYAVPAVYLGMKARRRQKRFINQLGDTIALMANSLRAGYSLLQTMEMVSRESPEPMSKEFMRVVREIGLGVSNQEAMHNLLRRVPSDDLDLLVTAINIQHEVGGNLAQILQIIGHTIRERVKIKGEISVLTAQQRLSGYIISGLPVALAIFIFFMNPDYLMELFKWPWICMPIASSIMIVIGFFVMKKITAIEV
jgi:tight adherence protein B